MKMKMKIKMRRDEGTKKHYRTYCDEMYEEIEIG